MTKSEFMDFKEAIDGFSLPPGFLYTVLALIDRLGYAGCTVDQLVTDFEEFVAQGGLK